MTKKLVGSLSRYGWKPGVHQNAQFGQVNSLRTAAGLSQDPLTTWEFFVVTPSETWGANTNAEAQKLWRSMTQSEAVERSMKTFKQFQKEDEGAGAPANSAGLGNIAGLGVGKAGKPANWGEPSPRKKRPYDVVTELVEEGLLESADPTDTFAGAAVFEVDMEKVHNSRFGKNRYHRYSRYVGEDEIGQQIRQHGRDRKSGDIILKDSKTAVMTYLRRKQPVQ